MEVPCGQYALRNYPLCLKQAKETKQAMNPFGGFCGAGARSAKSAAGREMKKRENLKKNRKMGQE